MENKIKIYKDHKELPFYNYSRIMHTGDFLYMIKGYDSGDEIEADPLEMKQKFDELVQEFVMETNGSSEELHNHAQYIISTIEFSKITIMIGVMELLIATNKKLKELGKDVPDDKDFYDKLFHDVIIERNDDPEKQLKILYQSKSFHENNIEKYKAIVEKDENVKEDKENDVDKMFINVCLGLEISPPDKKNITLYDFYIMAETVVEKMKALDKINNK